MGNRTQQTAPSGTTAYTYDNNNRLLTAGSTSYAYDANGNLLSISTGQTFTWDVFNRLTQAVVLGATVTYTYNGDGLKPRRVESTNTRNYYYDGIRPLWETDAARQMVQQYDRDLFGNLLSRKDSAGARRYYHYDGLGSATALTNETGTVTATMLYDAWGNVRASTGSNWGRYRFTGAEWDGTTNLYHMGARFYDPTIGRWLSEDPVQDKPFEPATLNFYAYVYSDPLVHTDPDGQIALNVAAGLVGVAVGLGVYGATHWGNMTVQGALTYAAVGGLVGFSLGTGLQAVAAAGVAGLSPAARGLLGVAARGVRNNHCNPSRHWDHDHDERPARVQALRWVDFYCELCRACRCAHADACKQVRCPQHNRTRIRRNCTHGR